MSLDSSFAASRNRSQRALLIWPNSPTEVDTRIWSCTEYTTTIDTLEAAGEFSFQLDDSSSFLAERDQSPACVAANSGNYLFFMINIVKAVTL
jgi:hypothetical protein